MDEASCHLLGQDSPHTSCIYFNNKLPFDVRDLEDGCRAETVLQSLEGSVWSIGPTP